jgi:hypothetical protein
MIYANLDFDSLLPIWMSRFLSIDPMKIEALAGSVAIPSQWYTSEKSARIVSRLIERQPLLEAYSDSIKSSFCMHSTQEQMNKWDEQLAEIQLHGSQSCPDSDRRIGRSMFPVG